MSLLSKKSRVFGISLTVVCLFIFFLFSRRAFGPSEIADTLSDSSLIDSTNDASKDEAINMQISAEMNGLTTNKDMGNQVTDDSGHFDPANALIEIRSMGPMIVFSKSYCRFSQKLKKLLSEEYSITPAPIIVELDKHQHGAELQSYLGVVTRRNLVPNVLLGPDTLVSKGGAEEFMKYHNDGTLADHLNSWGGKDISVYRIEIPLNHR